MVQGHFLGRAPGDDRTAPVTAFRTHINDIVGGLDDIQVMLDDHDRIAAFHQGVEDAGQLGHIIEVEARGGFVQDVDGTACTAPGQLGRQLDPLCFAAGQFGGGLPQLDIAQAHVIEGPDLTADGGQVLKEIHCLLHGHVEDIVNVLIFIAHFQGLPVVALAVAHLAGNVHIRQEVHFDPVDTVAPAGFAAAALDIKGKAPFGITPGFGIRGGGKEVADHVENARIGGRVGPGRPPDGGLVNVDDLVQLVHAFNAVVRAGNGQGPVQVPAEPLVEDLVDQGALAGTGYAGHSSHDAQREADINVFQVVDPGPLHGQPAARPPADRRDRDVFGPLQVLTRHGFGDLHDFLRRSGGHHPAAMGTGAGSDVDDIVGGPHGVLVVFDHDDRIPQVAQVLEGPQQLVVVPLVEADAGLIQNIADADQAGTDLGSQTDPLGLAARQGGRGPGQGQVIQAHVDQEADPGFNLLEDLAADHLLGLRQLQAVDMVPQPSDGQAGQVINVHAAHGHRQGFFPQSLPFAGLAGGDAHELFIFVLAVLGSGLFIALLDVADQALESDGVDALAPLALVMDIDGAVGAVHQGMADRLRQLAPGSIQTEAQVSCQGGQDGVGKGSRLHAGLPAQDRDGPVIDGTGRIRDDQVRIELHPVAQARTVGTGAEGIVKGKASGLDLGDGGPAVGAGEVLAELAQLSPDDVHLEEALGQAQGVLDGIGQAPLNARPDHQTVHDDLNVMLDVLFQLNVFGNVILAAVDPQADIAGPAGPVNDFGVLALAAPDHRRQQLQAGALGQGHDLVHHLVHGLTGDLPAAFGAVGNADPGVEQTQVIVNLRHSSYRGSGVAVGGFLVDGDGRGQTVDLLHVRLFHLAQELTGIGGQGFHISALALRVNGIEGQGGLAAARQAGQDDQLVAGNGQVNSLQVMLPGAFDPDAVLFIDQFSAQLIGRVGFHGLLLIGFQQRPVIRFLHFYCHISLLSFIVAPVRKALTCLPLSPAGVF